MYCNNIVLFYDYIVLEIRRIFFFFYKKTILYLYNNILCKSLWDVIYYFVVEKVAKIKIAIRFSLNNKKKIWTIWCEKNIKISNHDLLQLILREGEKSLNDNNDIIIIIILILDVRRYICIIFLYYLGTMNLADVSSIINTKYLHRIFGHAIIILFLILHFHIVDVIKTNQSITSFDDNLVNLQYMQPEEK